MEIPGQAPRDSHRQNLQNCASVQSEGGFVGFVGCSTHTFPKWKNVPEAELDARIAAQIASEEFWDGYHFAAFDSLPGREDLDRAATWNECLYRLKRRVSS
jgi:hypothetical protein